MCITIVALILPTISFADIGPKPSVVIDFEGLENETYYVTLLSEVASTGPHSALLDADDYERYQPSDAHYEIWQKFINYKDTSGYYFLQFFGDATQTHRFVWGYYPPPKFKILLYFPEVDRFVVSDTVYERYAFDSYFTVDAKHLNFEMGTSSQTITAEKQYFYTWEIFSLFVRIIATIVIEILIALLFGFKAKKQLQLIIVVNIITQTLLNILLNITNYKYGNMMFLFNYFWLEALVLAIEAKVYAIYLPKLSGEHSKKPPTFVYALTANVVSFLIGLYIAYLIPGIF